MGKISKDKIKTWFITGASSGVGKKLAHELLNRGYNVIAVSRRIPDISHENVLCLSVDVTKPETIKKAIQKGIERFGRIDVLSNNAGIWANIIAEEETLEHMKEVMETNFFGTYNTIHALLPHFRENQNGTIISNTSQSGLSPRSYGAAYCSSKYAIEGLTGVCWIETQKFCRVMTFELGWFEGTNISLANQDYSKHTSYDEYENLKPAHKHFYYSFKNDLDLAVKFIIDQVEKENLPRRLILGKDAYIKVKAEIASLEKDLRKSKRRAFKCAKFDKEFPKKAIKKIAKVVFKKELNV